jgi:hypothetical protein
MAVTINPIDFQSVSFEKALADILAFVDAKSDANKWRDFVASGVGTTLLENIAGLGVFASFHEIVRRKEQYIDTAKFITSLFELAFGKGVFLPPYSTAELSVSIKAPAGDGDITFGVGTYVGTMSDYEVYALTATTISEGTTGTVTCVVGQSNADLGGSPTELPETTISIDSISQFSTIEVDTNKKYPASQLERLVQGVTELTLSQDVYSLAVDVNNLAVLRRVTNNKVSMYIGTGVLGWLDTTSGNLAYRGMSFGDDLANKLTESISLNINGEPNVEYVSHSVTSNPTYGIEKERVRWLANTYPSDSRIVRNQDYEAILLTEFTGIFHDIYAKYDDEPNEEEILYFIKDDNWSRTTIVSAQTTISASVADNSFNDSGSGFGASLSAGDFIEVTGFVHPELTGVFEVISATTAKIVVDFSWPLPTESAGPSVSVYKVDDMVDVKQHVDERRALGINVIYRKASPTTDGSDYAITLVVNPYIDIYDDIITFLNSKINKFMKTNDNGYDVTTGQDGTVSVSTADDSFNHSLVGDPGFAVTNLSAGDLIFTEGFSSPGNSGLFTVTGTPTTSKIQVTANLTTEGAGAAPILRTIRKVEKTKFNVYDLAVELSKEFDRPFSVHGYVISGFTGADPGATLTMTLAEGDAYIRGVTFAISTSDSKLTKTYTASKDTYVDLSKDQTFTYTEVPNGGAVPSIPTNNIRIAKVVTDGTEITSVTDLRELESISLAPHQFLQSIPLTLLTS